MSEFAMGDRFYTVQGEPLQRKARAPKAVGIDWAASEAGAATWFTASGGDGPYRKAEAASSFGSATPKRRQTRSPASIARSSAPSHGARGAARNAHGAHGARAGIERSLAILLAAVGAAILAAAAFLVLPGLLRVSHFVVTGATSLSDEEVLGAALVHGNEYFFSLDPEAMRASLMTEPRVAEAVVTRHFPNGLSIAVVERKAAAIVLVEEDGKLLPVCVDASGVAFDYASRALPAASSGIDLPILSGMRFERFRPGTRLPRDFVPTLAAIAEIERTAPALLAAFSEIKLVKPAYGEPELLLYSLHHRVPVRTGAVLNESTLRSIILVLDVIGSRNLADGVKEIDFRTGTVVYRVKEGQPG